MQKVCDDGGQDAHTSKDYPPQEEHEAHIATAGSKVDCIQSQRDLSTTDTRIQPRSDQAEFINTQVSPQMSAAVSVGSNNNATDNSGSTTHNIGPTVITDTVQRQPCYEGNEVRLGCFVNSGTTSGEWNANLEANAQDIKPNNEVTKSSSAQQAADICEVEMKTKYITTGSYVQTVPWVEGEKRDMRQIYTNLQLRHETGKEKETPDNLQSCGYNFLTTWEHGHKRVILAGTAGLGKSTLLGKIACDWATGVETLARYKLVFLLKMHSLDETSQLIDAIFDQLLDHDTDVQKSDLEVFIHDNPHKMLILLDGFNELMTSNLNEHNFGSILKILNRKIGRECYVITTTRPSHKKELVHESLITKPYTRIDVLGFAKEDIDNYVMSFFHEQPDKAEELLLRIQSKDVLYDMAKRPMFLLLMCLLWGENNELPDTMASLYKTAMENFFKRKSKQVASKQIFDILTKIGKFALHCLLDPKLMLSCEEADIEESVFDAAIKSGVITSQQVIKGVEVRTRIQFLHRTIQEYCAALYIQSLSKSNPYIFQQTIQQVESLTKDNPISFEYLFRFCCVNAECMNEVLQMLQDYQDQRLALECYYESKSDELPPADFINNVISDSITIPYWNSDCINSLMHFLEQLADQTKVQGNIYLKKVLTLNMIKCNLLNFSHRIACCINKMTSITVLKLIECSLTAKTMKALAESLDKPSLVELDLSWNDGLRDSVHLWFSGLQSIKKLVLHSCSLTGNDIKHIAVSQKIMPTIVELVLTGNRDAFDSVESVLLFCNDLKNLSHLESLTLRSCSLKGNIFKSIAIALGKIPTLTELNLVGNTELGGSAELWSLCLKEMKRLKKLDFRHCSLEAEDVYRILSSGMLSLLCLKLSGNHALSGKTNEWCSQIHSLPCIEELELKDCELNRSDFTCLVLLFGSMRRHIHCCFDFQDVQHFLVIERLSTGVRLDLSECCLSEKMLDDVLKAISNRHDIVELALGVNEGLGGCAIGWSRYLMDLMKLEKLDLRRCKILSTDVKALATSLGQISTLVELNLSENVTLGGSAAEWAIHLARLQHIKKLHLRKCSLRSLDVKDMATALCEVHSLVELDLSINGFLRNTEDLWNHLTHMKQLQNLDLSWCSLISEDVQYIAKTLSCMPALIRLNLSNNCTLPSLASFQLNSDNVFLKTSSTLQRH